MKSRILSFLLFLLITSAVRGQFRLSATAGPQWSSLKMIPGGNYSEKDLEGYIRKRTALHIGLEADIPLEFSEKFSLVTGLSYSGKGRKFNRINSEEVASLTDTLIARNDLYTNYIEFPLLLSYHFKRIGNKNFTVSGGTYGAFFLNGKSISETRLFSSNKYSREEMGMTVGKGVNSVRTFDGGLSARVTMDAGKFKISAFYLYGITKAYINENGSGYRQRTAGISIGIWLMNEVQRKPKDSDLDGINDEEDHCPLLPGTALTKGCPDRDGDGIADHNDQCPDEKGMIRYQGCPIPDSDQDGINDEDDQCPQVKGFERYKGCPIPDKDGDGINDETDACPAIPGTSTYRGCPVPDSDGDGLDDEHDECPQVKGIPEENGCPLTIQKVEKKIEFAAKNIFFASNSAVIDSVSYASLDEVVNLMNEFAEINLIINGHTDNTGDPLLNQLISQQRAEAVKKYLSGKWIDPKRITAKGYGQSHPIDSNDTPEGRAQNRRVELKIKK